MSGLDLDAAMKHLRRADPGMRPLIDRHGPPPLRPYRNRFQFLARAIIYQQLSGNAARTIYGRFVALYPSARFPTADAVAATPLNRLRKAGLSRQKASYLKDLARKFTDGTIHRRRLSRMSEEEISRELTQVKGIGQWTVDMLLIFALNRPDVFPVGDLGIRKGLQIYFALDDLPEPETMVGLAEPWRPYRSVASWYLWRVTETEVPG